MISTQLTTFPSAPTSATTTKPGRPDRAEDTRQVPNTTDPESFVVCERSGVYHFGAPPRRPFSTGAALCGACDAWPEGGIYRSGRRRPFLADSLPTDRRLCERCAAIAADNEDAEQAPHPIFTMVGQLVRKARTRGTDLLVAVVRNTRAPIVVRQSAYVVLQERGVVQAGGNR